MAWGKVTRKKLSPGHNVFKIKGKEAVGLLDSLVDLYSLSFMHQRTKGRGDSGCMNERKEVLDSVGLLLLSPFHSFIKGR